MTLQQRIEQDPGLATLLQTRSLTIDDLAEVRAVHAAAFRFSAKALLLDAELDAAIKQIATVEYTDTLAKTNLIGGFVEGCLVATAGWRRADNRSGVARISAIAVLPLFVDCGIGRRMLAEVEARARAAGLTEYVTRLQPHAVPFFVRMGYDVIQQGLRPGPLEPAMPMAVLGKKLPAFVC